MTQLPLAESGIARDYPGQSRESGSGRSAAAAADRSAAEADAAVAARFEALGDAVAAGLNHLAAGVIARAAGDAHPIGRAFAGAAAQCKIALADADAVLQAAHRTQAVAQLLAEVLQRGAGQFVFTTTVELGSVGTLLDTNRAAWYQDRSPRGRSRCRHRRTQGARSTLHHHHCSHPSFSLNLGRRRELVWSRCPENRSATSRAGPLP